MQVLDFLLIAKMESGRLKCMKFEEEELHLGHQLFANNVTAVIEADEDNLNNCKEEFDSFRKVLGLECDWNNTSAIYLGLGVILDFIRDKN